LRLPRASASFFLSSSEVRMNDWDKPEVLLSPKTQVCRGAAPAVGAVRRPPITIGVWSSPPGNVGIQFVFFKQNLGVAGAHTEHLLKKNCLEFELRNRCSPVAPWSSTSSHKKAPSRRN